MTKLTSLEYLLDELDFGDEEEELFNSLQSLHNFWVLFFIDMDDIWEEQALDEDEAVFLAEKEALVHEMLLSECKDILETSDKYENIWKKCKKAIDSFYREYAKEKLDYEISSNKTEYTEESYSDELENRLLGGLTTINLAFFFGFEEKYDLEWLEKEDIDNPEFWKNDFIERVVRNTEFLQFL